jgi:chemotaxis protein methyltransferase CheR
MRENSRDSEFTFSAAGFERVRKLIYQRAGISLHDGNLTADSRLSRRFRDIGHSSFADYLQWLEQVKGPEGEVEWRVFINSLATNLTSFLREDHLFLLLAAELGHRWHMGAAPCRGRCTRGRRSCPPARIRPIR